MAVIVPENSAADIRIVTLRIISAGHFSAQLLPDG
jgi:hypothetical protein